MPHRSRTQPRPVSTRIAGLVAAGLAVGAGAILAAAPAGASGGCVPPRAEFSDAAHQNVHMSGGFHKASNGVETIGYTYQGTDSNGMAVSGAGDCGDPNWERFTLDLRDGDDMGRLDARRPRFHFIFTMHPIPNRITATINGGSGDDTLLGHGGRDVLNGDTGRDVLKAADDGRDVLDCGPGRDSAVADRSDNVSNCEQVTYR